MHIRTRTLYVRQPKDAESGTLLGRILRELHDALLIAAGQDESFPGWPRVDWQGEGASCQVAGWTSEEKPDDRLVEATLAQIRGEQTWTIRLRLGTERPDEVVIQETCELAPDRAELPVENAPSLLDFLDDFPSADEDSLDARRPYTVAKNRAEPFAEFIKKSFVERKLPVVLVTPRIADGALLVPPPELVVPLRGMAHVMSLNNRARWYSGDLPLPDHPCFNGAVRIYMPDYTPDDPPGRHRFWHPDKIEESGPDVIAREIVQEVHEYMASRRLENPVLQRLLRRKEEERIQQQVRSQVETARERHRREFEALRARIRDETQAQAQAQTENMFADFQADYEKLAADYDRVIAENERLLLDNRSKDDQIRRLNYQLSAKWTGADDAVEPATSTPALKLSQQAWDLYRAQDAGVRRSIVTQLLQKLCDPNLRERQTEPIDCRDGQAFVYPRRRSADGKRAIYMLEGETVKVCEVFTHHDAYEQARNQEFILNNYTNFHPWLPEDESGRTN